jgi:hypothetical protein
LRGLFTYFFLPFLAFLRFATYVSLEELMALRQQTAIAVYALHVRSQIWTALASGQNRTFPLRSSSAADGTPVQ